MYGSARRSRKGRQGVAFLRRSVQLFAPADRAGRIFRRVFFRKTSDKPFLPAGEAGSWNSSESGHPYVFADDDGRTYLFYQGSSDNGATWYLSKRELLFDGGVPALAKEAV